MEHNLLKAARRRGAKHAILWAFPVTALLTLLIGFPFPFAGYAQGVEAAMKSPIAIIMWGILFGGFIFLGGLGYVAGWKAYCDAGSDQSKLNRMATLYALIVVTPPLVFLSLWFRFFKW